MFAKLADTFFIEGKLFAFKGPLRTEGRKEKRKGIDVTRVSQTFILYIL